MWELFIAPSPVFTFLALSSTLFEQCQLDLGCRGTVDVQAELQVNMADTTGFG